MSCLLGLCCFFGFHHSINLYVIISNWQFNHPQHPFYNRQKKMLGIMAVGAFWGTFLYGLTISQYEENYSMFSYTKDTARKILRRGYRFILKKVGKRTKARRPKIMKLKEHKFKTDEEKGLFVPSFSLLSQSGLMASAVSSSKTKKIEKPARKKVGVNQLLRRRLLKSLHKKEKTLEEPNQFRDGKKEENQLQMINEIEESESISVVSHGKSEMEIEELVKKNNGMILQVMKQQQQREEKEKRQKGERMSLSQYDPFEGDQCLTFSQF